MKGKMIVGSVDGCTTSKSNGVLDRKMVVGTDAENPDINITDGVNHGEGDGGDTTEDPSGSSSSFDDTFSGVDGTLGLSDDEINSELCGGGQQLWGYHGFEEEFRTRKKKVTSHWRNFIRPIMWRCKWAELQMKKLQSHVSTYSKILAEYDQERESWFENFSAESQCSRSMPFPHHIKRKKKMQRKKRKRIEDTTDIASYLQQHNLFAYCENKGTSSDNAHLINGRLNLGAPAIRNSDTILVDNDYLLQIGNEETSQERILANIDSMQSLVHNMTSRVGKVINENLGKFSSLDKLTVLSPCDSSPCTALDLTTWSTDRENIPVTSACMTLQPASELCLAELTMSTNPVAADQAEDPVPSNTESADQNMVSKKADNVEDEVPLKKRPIKDNLIVYKRGMLPAKKHRILSEEQPNTSSTGHTQSQHDKSDVFLASQGTSQQSNQKKRGKKAITRSGRKQSKRLSLKYRF